MYLNSLQAGLLDGGLPTFISGNSFAKRKSQNYIFKRFGPIWAK